jgi:hypothetical protein
MEQLGQEGVLAYVLVVKQELHGRKVVGKGLQFLDGGH